MKSLIFLFSVLSFSVLFLTGCVVIPDELDLSEIDIEAIDQVDVPAGTYTIEYTIDDLSSLIKSYGAVIDYIVIDSSSDPVDLSGTTFTVVAGEVYTVTIRLTVGEESITKVITVTAVADIAMVTVSFELNGGTGDIQSQIIATGSAPDLAIVPIRDGFVFDGWYVDQILSIPYMNTAIEADSTLYANWIPELDLSLVKIDAFDQTDVPAGTYTIVYAIADLSNLINRYGAVIDYVVTDSSSDKVDLSGTTFTVVAGEVYTVTIRLSVGAESIAKTITVTAVADITMVTVTFELNGGAGDFQSQIITSGSTPDLTAIPNREGFVFEGWYVDQILSIPYMNTAIDADTTLYANWMPEEIPTVPVTFDLMGGQGDIEDQWVELGGYALRPSGIPTKPEYVFAGWFVGPESSQPYDFETMAVHGQTVIFAHWSLDLTITYTVTYDFNGGLQTETIEETVVQTGYAQGLSVNPEREGYLFAGWSTDQMATEAIDLSSFPIESDTTLYAIWHLDLEVIDGSSYFGDMTAIDDSTLENGDVFQQMRLNVHFEILDLEDDFLITEDRLDYGIIYSHQSTTPTYYDLLSTMVLGTLTFDESYVDPWTPEHLYALNLGVTSDSLLSDTSYFAVFYVRYESMIVYSDVYEFQTAVTVPTGSAIGSTYVLSGGYYRFDNGTETFRPGFWVEIHEGYSATVDGESYASWDMLYRAGTRTLITTDLATGKQYLHVFHVDFETPHVSVTFSSFSSTTSGNILPIYEVTFPHDQDINYDVSEVGVLYSTEHPFLKFGVPSVSHLTGDLSSLGSFDTNGSVPSSYDQVYIRGYVIVGDKISYAPYVTILDYQSSEYIVSGQHSFDTNEVSPENGYSWSFGANTYLVYTVTDDSIVSAEYTGEINLSGEGQYFITSQTITWGITDVLINGDYPDVIGVEPFGQYVGSVTISYDTYNPDWYYEKDGGDYVYLPSMIKLSEPGWYVVHYRTAQGMAQISFEIVSQA